MAHVYPDCTMCLQPLTVEEKDFMAEKAIYSHPLCSKCLTQTEKRLISLVKKAQGD